MYAERGESGSVCALRRLVTRAVFAHNGPGTEAECLNFVSGLHNPGKAPASNRDPRPLTGEEDMSAPLPLQRDLVQDFRIAMTPVSSEDWDALKRRADAARRLGVRAYVDEDRAAWEVVQVLEWRLQMKSNL